MTSTMLPETKACGYCSETKPIEDFPLRSRANGGTRAAWCRSCTTKRRLCNRYGITMADYEAWNDEGVTCKICGIEPWKMKSGRPSLVIDHNHKTGKIRGMLCGSCNVGIGYIEKRGRDWLEKALKYIEDLD